MCKKSGIRTEITDKKLDCHKKKRGYIGLSDGIVCLATGYIPLLLTS